MVLEVTTVESLEASGYDDIAKIIMDSTECEVAALSFPDLGGALAEPWGAPNVPLR